VRLDDVLDALAAEAIEARPIWTPLHRFPTFEAAPRLGGDVAEGLAARAISLPSTSSLSAGDQDRVIRALEAAVARPAARSVGPGAR
jgi:pyridoxal phosphate-dependent aminotransferase EpsN